MPVDPGRDYSIHCSMDTSLYCTSFNFGSRCDGICWTVGLINETLFVQYGSHRAHSVQLLWLDSVMASIGARVLFLHDVDTIQGYSTSIAVFLAVT